MRNCLIVVAVIAWAVLPLAKDLSLAQVTDQPQPAENNALQPPGLDKQEPIKGYRVRTRRIGTPMDVEYDLDNSFPKSDSLLELILQCQENRKQ